LLSEVTGLESRDWVTLAVVALALVLVARSLAVPVGGNHRQRHPLPAIAGVIMVASLIAFSLLLPDLPVRVGSNPLALAGTVALALVAIAIADFLFFRVVPFIRTILAKLGLSSRATLHAALVVALIPVVAVPTLFELRISSARAVTDVVGQIGEVEEFDLPGDPLGIVMVDGLTGYVTLGQGTILRFELPDARGELRSTTVTEGLEFPRGITIANDRVYVVELGDLPCKPAFPNCLGDQVGPNPADGERMILRTARGRVSSFAVETGGRLSDRRVLLADLPVVDSLHAVNSLVTGPDGDVYVAIGNLDALWKEPTAGQGTTPHPDWLGTVLRVDPRSGQADVYARGLRNVYGLTFDDRGGLWGVDNNGPALGDWRAEELLQLKQGRNYGYPMDGTFGPWSQRDDGPVWTLDVVGSAGILWAGDASMGPGVFVGSCGGLSYLPLHEIDGRWTVQNPDAHAVQLAHLLEVSGCVTDIAAVGPRTILASVFGFGGGGKLLRITLSGNGP
jgi:glucose/sorbosone dehydrogenase